MCGDGGKLGWRAGGDGDGFTKNGGVADDER